MSQSEKFQVDLGGIIDLLSNHLYSTPDVFLRELLQNGVDAISARRHLDSTFTVSGNGDEADESEPPSGEVTFEILSGDRGPKSRTTLLVQDNGVGLTADEIQIFLATIGRSSKRESLNREDFIGQFGIGLLSCFVVADEITVITRSARPGSPAMEWRGNADGTYALRTLTGDFSVGTQVFLQPKPGKEEFFEASRIEQSLRRYGGHLPIPVRLRIRDSVQELNEPGPWTVSRRSPQAWRKRMLAYGEQTFGTRFLDAVPLRSETGDVTGVAFVLQEAASLSSRRGHCVYLKQMLLSEQAENLVPDWAFFVKCVLNVDDLRPTASRESFYDDEKLLAVREALGAGLREYLVRLSAEEPERFADLIGIHFLAIKSLAVEDDEFYEFIIEHLPFETTLGRVSLREYLESDPTVRYVLSDDEFRQVAAVAAAQGMHLINGGFVHDHELLSKLPAVFPDRPVERLDIATLTEAFEELTDAEQDEAFTLIAAADQALKRFGCIVDVKKFQPAQVPVLYTVSQDALFERDIERSRENADDLWSGLLDGMAASRPPARSAQLCLNYRHRLIQRLARVTDRDLIRRTVEVLYVQALLLGHYPLKPEELSLMGEGLLTLVERVLEHTAEEP